MRKILTNYKIYLFVVVFISKSCSSQKLLSEDIEGVYVQNEMKNIELYLKEGVFSLIDTNNSKHMPLYKCCDTITYGSWKFETNQFINLSSPDELGNYVNLIVEESRDESLNDSVNFIIKNPIEFHYKKFNERYREISYNLNITTNNDFLDERMETNIYKLLIDKNIIEFEILIEVKDDIPLRNSLRKVYTIPYKVKNSKSNLFKINIPELSYNFLSYKRLNNDYIKVINKNKLFWDGNTYTKKR